jgi:hypothetical protein
MVTDIITILQMRKLKPSVPKCGTGILATLLTINELVVSSPLCQHRLWLIGMFPTPLCWAENQEGS